MLLHRLLKYLYTIYLFINSVIITNNFKQLWEKNSISSIFRQKNRLINTCKSLDKSMVQISIIDTNQFLAKNWFCHSDYENTNSNVATRLVKLCIEIGTNISFVL